MAVRYKESGGQGQVQQAAAANGELVVSERRDSLLPYGEDALTLSHKNSIMDGMSNGSHSHTHTEAPSRASDNESELSEERAWKGKIIQEYVDQKEAQRKLIYHKRKEEVMDFALSVGAIRDVLKADYLATRLVWLGLGLFAVGMCGNEMRRLIEAYVNQPASTKISYLVNSSLEFPLITICTYSRVNSTKIREAGIDNELLTYMLSTFKGMYLFYNKFNLRMQQKQLQQKYQNFLDVNNYHESNFSLTKYFLQQGFECSKFLRSCMFRGEEFDCCTQFKMEILTDIGKCFVVKSKVPEQKIPGPTGGLRVFVNNWASEYPSTFINSNADQGIQIHIIHPQDTSYIGVSPLIVFPNTHALVRMKAINQLMLEKPGRPDSCVNYKPLRFYDTYSYEGCFTECITNMTYDTCTCVQIGSVANFELLNEEEICTPTVATVCVQALLQANNMGYLSDIFDIKSYCDCPLPCKQWTYETTVTYSQIANYGYDLAWKERLNEQPNSNYSFSPDYILLDLFYDSLYYTQIVEQESTTFTIFISNIGGQLSIWLGLRIISLVHIIYYGALLLVYLLPVWVNSLRVKARERIMSVTTGTFTGSRRNTTVSSRPRSERGASGATTPKQLAVQALVDVDEQQRLGLPRRSLLSARNSHSGSQRSQQVSPAHSTVNIHRQQSTEQHDAPEPVKF